MKDTPQSKTTKSRPKPCLEQQMKVRVPEDFVFRLLGLMVSDLAERPRASGDAPVLCHPDIDLSEVKKALRSRSLPSLLEAVAPFAAQSISAEWSDQPEIAFGLYQLHTLLKKYPVSEDTNASNAFASFCDYEAHCELYNRENSRSIVALNKRHPDFLGIIEEIRDDIQKCIGAEPPIQCIYDDARHGPGTAIGLNNPMVTSYFKWSMLPYTVSPSALPYAREAIESDPRWIGALLDNFRKSLGIPMWAPIDMTVFWSTVFKVVDYCQYSTVPKSAVTDRSIGVEPTLNVFLQLGVDGVIRKRLKNRWKIDLNTQSLNQLLCWQSSISNDDATIDLKGASDCVSLAVVFLLLPLSWFNLLMDLRSRNILIPKKFLGEEEIRPLHKISAMGNGFTFALETLIFAAICRAVMRRAKIKGNLAVYGDDIIVPRIAAPKVIDLLDRFGFMVNKEKTFITGPFRESCGVDCLSGINIRPFFLKKPVVDVTDIWYIHNSLRELERRLPEFWEISFADTKAWLKSFIPVKFRRLRGPASESLDTYLHFEGTKFDRNGLAKHDILVPLALTFNDRAPGWFFRKLMVSLRGHTSDAQERLQSFKVHRLLGVPLDYLQSGWKTGGTTRDMQTASVSAFDVTLRGVVKYTITTHRAWRK